MSLASTWLPTKSDNVVVDAGLDEIFKASAGPSVLAQRLATTSVSAGAQKVSSKRKNESINENVDQFPRKRRVSTTDSSSSKKPKEGKDKHAKQKGEGKEKEMQHEDSDDDPDDVDVDAVEHSATPRDQDSNSESDADAEPPLHETLQKKSNGKKKSGAKKEKYVPEGETREQRDARTIFIGNLPVTIVRSRPLAKALRRHILSYVPTAKIETLRFRSVAFQNPTTKLGLSDDDEAPSAKKQRSHKRATEWRDKGGKGSKGGDMGEDEEVLEDKKAEKQYLTPAQKRRLAAIKGDVHESAAATVNAYVVFAYPIPPPPRSEDGEEGKRRKKEAMDPFEAACEAVRACDGTVFEGRTLRVDFVGKPSRVGSGASDAASAVLTDPKLSVFVGNLDFASREDDLRAFFEKVMIEERGHPDIPKIGEEPVKDEKSDEESDDGEEERSEEESSREKARRPKGKMSHVSDKKPTWVTRIRIVRDRDTQLGKGFAYIQFADRDCVDEILALEPEKLKFAKRKLRVQRCKTVPGAGLQSTSQTSSKGTKVPQTKASPSFNKPKTTLHPPPKIELPKGDPSLGTRIASLPKDQRKAAKAADPGRIARRLAKKKTRMAMEKDLPKGKGKERIRERKDRREKGGAKKGKKDAKKRVRSERSVEKRNVKK